MKLPKPEKPSEKRSGSKPLPAEAAVHLGNPFYKMVAGLSAECLPSKVLKRAIQGGMDLLGLDSGEIALWDEERRRLVLRSTQNMSADFEGRTRPPEEGIIGEVFRTGKTAVEENPLFPGPEKFKEKSCRAAIATPLKIGDEIIGFLRLQTASLKRKISEQDALLLEAWAGHAAIAIRNAERFEANRRRSARSEILQRNIKEINSSLSLATVLRQALRHGVKLCGMESGWILLWDDPEECFVVKTVVNAPEALVGKRLKWGEDLPGRAAQEQRILIANDYGPESPPFSAAIAGRFGALMAIPLVRREKPIGILCCAAEESDRHVSKVVQKEVELFSRHAAVAIFNADTFQSLRTASGELEQKMEGAARESPLLREQMVRKEKLAALGQIVGSVNHEFRQPLEVITNAVYYLKAQMERNDIGPIKKEFERFLNIISEECVNTTDLVNELLNFTRKKDAAPLAVDLNKLLESQLQRIQIPDKVRLKKRFAPALPMIHADPVQLSRAFQNIILNGIQAMPKGGVLHVSTESSSGPAAVAIRDSGIGISPDHMKKIFEPLFTTKVKGVGLGLSLVKEYVEANQGRIEVQSKVGAGTTFRISFPALPLPEPSRASLAHLEEGSSEGEKKRHSGIRF